MTGVGCRGEGAWERRRGETVEQVTAGLPQGPQGSSLLGHRFRHTVKVPATLAAEQVYSALVAWGQAPSSCLPAVCRWPAPCQTLALEALQAAHLSPTVLYARGPT